MVVFLLLHTAIFLACAVIAVAQCAGRSIFCGPLTVNLFCRESIPEYDRMKSVLFRAILDRHLPYAVGKASLMRPRVVVESKWITLKGINRFLKKWRDGKVPRRFHLTFNWPVGPEFTTQRIEEEMLNGLQYLEADEHRMQASSYMIRDQIDYLFESNEKECKHLIRATGKEEEDGELLEDRNPTVHLENAYEIVYDGRSEMPSDILFSYITHRHIPTDERNYVESSDHYRIIHNIAESDVGREEAGADPQVKPKSLKLLVDTGNTEGQTTGGQTTGGQTTGDQTTEGGTTGGQTPTQGATIGATIGATNAPSRATALVTSVTQIGGTEENKKKKVFTEDHPINEVAEIQAVNNVFGEKPMFYNTITIIAK